MWVSTCILMGSKEIEAVRLLRGIRMLFFVTLPETSSKKHLKMDGWKTILSFWVSAYFQGRAVSFRESSCPIVFQNLPYIGFLRGGW